MKKFLLPALALALAITVTTSATVTTPNSTSTTATTTSTSTKATSTKIETRGERVISTKQNDNQTMRPGYNRNNNNNNKDKDSLTKKELLKVEATCAKDALAKRDTIVNAALQNYATGWINSINTRRAAQNIAFDQTGTERIQSIRASRVVAKKTQDLIQRELRKTKNAAGDAFRAQMRLCGIAADSQDE